jgi:glyoxylase-like metal-dependent hydrolase (beta-lactamase superfamily II)
MITFYESTHKMLPGVHTTVRSTVITTLDGVIVLCPIHFTSKQVDEIRAQGPVVAIIETNMHHTAYAAEAKARFPKAELWGVKDLPTKKPHIGWSKILAQDTWPYAPELQTIPIRGVGKMHESVFYHPATKTLIVTDLVFNMKKSMGFLTPITFRMMGVYKKFGVPSFWISMTSNEKALRESLKEILALDFTRLVMAHGEIIETNAKSLLYAALLQKKLI